MKKYLKYALYTLIAVAVLGAALIAIIAATVNPNDYKPLIVKTVQKTQHRTLKLEGDIKLTFFPKLGIDLGKASLSERNNRRIFAAVNDARIYVALFPLLRNEWVVDSLRIDGLRAHLVRYRNGTTNFDDLLHPQQGDNRDTGAGKPGRFRLDIQHIAVSRAALTFDDRQNGKKFRVSDLSLTSDRLADKTPGTIKLAFKFAGNGADLAARLSSNVFFDLGGQHYRLQDLTATVNGRAAGIQHLALQLQGNIDADLAHRSLHLTGLALKATGRRDGGLSLALDAPQLEIAPNKTTSGKLTLTAGFKQAAAVFNAKLTATGLEGSAKTLRIRQANLSMDGKMTGSTVSGTLATPLTIDLAAKRIAFPRWVAQLTVHNAKLPGGKSAARLQGSGRVNLAKGNARLQFSGALDQSKLRGAAGLSRFNPPAYTFDLAIDRLNIDRYFPPQPQKTAAPEKPFDFSALRRLDANGKVRIGTLIFSNIKANNVRIDIRARQGKLNIDPMRASLYQGKLNGVASLDARATPRIATRQTLSRVDINPLLRDAVGKDLLEGRGNIALNLTTTGATVSAMKRALNGTASLHLRDGAIKGINIAQTLRNAKARMGALKGTRTQSQNPQEKTDFTELNATFRIVNGVARNRDLSAKSPLLRLGGQGDIDIGAGRLDYLAKVTVVGSLQGQGGQGASTLKGVTVPLRMRGPWDGIKYSLDFNELGKSVVRQKVQQQKERVKSRVQEELKKGLKGLFR